MTEEIEKVTPIEAALERIADALERLMESHEAFVAMLEEGSFNSSAFSGREARTFRVYNVSD